MSMKDNYSEKREHEYSRASVSDGNGKKEIMEAKGARKEIGYKKTSRKRRMSRQRVG